MRKHNLQPILLLAFFLAAGTARAGDLAWSDPANAPPPPAGAIGWPSRDPGLDALPGFVNPPPGYGEVAFYWWLGDPLTKERIAWQLDQLDRVQGVMGLQVNYAHSDRGGRSYGLTYASDPPLFSKEWWDLFRWFVAEGKKRGMAASLSDYTLGVPGQGWWIDEILRDNSAMCGSTLRLATRDAAGGSDVAWEVSEGTLCVIAYRLQGGAIEPGSAVDLRKHRVERTVRWSAPAGSWRLAAVSAEPHPLSLDPMDPQCGKKVIETFFQRFEDHCPGEGGKGLNFFFSDELDFGVGGHLWNARFADEFRKRKGYDLVPELPALFLDTGPRTPKVRLDYWDVQVALSEEGYFRPLYDWHAKRGMIYGCDHGGRGRNVVEFGDYFRTQRWMPGPGCDSPGLSSDVIKNKVASSIAHLYQRPRTWLEGYHSSGWGTTSAQTVDATWRNFLQGHNLLTLHGLYYSTHGGWWEWAPPCNHFRMPYWPHMREFFRCSARLSYLLSQGVHRCDVAILYPVEPVQAGLGGQEAVAAAFGLGERLYGRGIDFDFLDFESLARAKVEDRCLKVSGEEYRVLVLPAMRAVRQSTIDKAREFARAGGMVVGVGPLPEASDRAGREDPQLAAAVKELYGTRSAPATTEQALEAIEKRPDRDFVFLWPEKPGPAVRPYVLHRRIGPRDVYAVYGVPRGSVCFFRPEGKVELWDPWTGKTRPLYRTTPAGPGTRIEMPLEATEVQLIVFSPGRPPDEVEVVAEAAAPPAALKLDGPWEFELAPALDNRFGDFHWPPTPGLVGAEARQFRYADETAPSPGWQEPSLDDSNWPRVTYSYGPRFWKLGPLPDGADTRPLEARLAALAQVDPAAPVELDGKKYPWQPYSFSMRFGVEGDPGHQGYHGLKELVPDEFIALGVLRHQATSTTREKEPGGSRYYLWSSVAAERGGPAHLAVGGLRPAAVWLGGSRLEKLSGTVPLKPGANPVLVRYDAPGRGYVVFSTAPVEGSPEESAPFSPAAFWIWYPREHETADRFFRKVFDLAERAANARLRITCDNSYTVWLNGQEVGRGGRWDAVQEYDVGLRLRPGRNVLAVAAHNDGDSAGLIAELRTQDAGVHKPRLATDASWRAARTAPQGWREAAFDDSAWIKAEPISPFAGSLWATHPHGPPKLEPAAEPAKAFQVSPLAMRWSCAPGVLPYDLRPQDARPAGWYRFTAPPGLRTMTIAARGAIQVWADGHPVGQISNLSHEAREFRQLPKLSYETYRASLARPIPSCASIAIRIQQERGCYGGAALPEPIRLDCDPGVFSLGDWAKNDVLACYSGGAWYRRTVELSAEQAAARVVLNLGDLVSSAEVRVNGKPAGVKVAPPWKLDLSGLVRPGENRIEVLVYNTLANHYTTIPTRYRGPTVSGLLGPVTLEFARPVVLERRTR